jgi:subtilisin family serine protease
MTRAHITLVFVLAIAQACGVSPLLLSETSGHGAAWADDDDDDDDDGGSDDDDNDDDDGGSGGGDDDDDGGSGGGDDDDDDDGGGAGGGTRGDDDDDGARPQRRGGGEDLLRQLFGQPQRQAPPPVRAPAPPPPPASAPNEIVALALTEADVSTLTAQGFEVIEEIAVPGLAVTSRRLRTPSGVSLPAARDAVRALPSGQDADFNHYYRSEQGFPEDCEGGDCPARLMIDWPLFESRDEACGQGVPIGMIDTGINADHATFSGAALEVRQLAPGELDPSRAIHGTAVAALLVGDPGTRSPGLVPASRLVALDAFHRVGGDERADVFTLIEALGELAAEGVGVINLSLAGPENAVLAEVVERLVIEEDIVVVAAVGNDGPAADPAYPAAYEPVLAVTAVDRSGAVYRRAVRGPHVDLAAPGVNVWTAASVSGARWKTGTSFATPFVSAAAAILREARPELTALEVGEELRRLATDLGDPGPDPVYGAGLLNIGSLCSDAS